MKFFILLFGLFPCFAFAQTAAQRQEQGQRQDTTIVFAGKREAPVARAFAYASNIVSKCSGSLGAGAQGQFAGISFSGSYKDEFCERAELIKIAVALGHGEIADELFYEFPMVKKLSKEGRDYYEEEVCDYPTKCKKRR